MHSALKYPFDSGNVLARKKGIKRELLESGDAFLEKRIAVLGGSTTHDILATLELFLLDNGISPIFYESEFGQYWRDAMFGNEKLDAFDPDLIFIHTSTRNIASFPELGASQQEINDLLDEQFGSFHGMWKNLQKKFNCPIIQNNFEMPAIRILGNRDAYDIHGRVWFVTELNRRFAMHAASQDGFYLNDIAYLSACYGLDEWSNPQYWYLYKYALCVPAIPFFSHNVACIIKSIFGKNKKGIVCDLDNTLWGGVIGDEGVEGISIGHETSESEAYLEFQRYLKLLKSAGVVLCVDSKNEYENAVAGLLHPDNALVPDDFVSIKANWDTKDRNFRKIASEINLLPESLVFLDDNPAERELVSSQISGVVAPELNRVEDYIHIVDRSGFFEAVSLSADDLSRNEMYKANHKRTQLEEKFEDYEDYLISLEMVATISPFDPFSIPRVTQLINKTNQFNLTAMRYTQSEVEECSRRDSFITLYASLSDRFGENGIISALIGRVEQAALHIDLWVMSCRVFRRGVEDAMLDNLVVACREAGIAKICGRYHRTQKNGPVRDFYKSMGFSLLGSSEAESSWELLLKQYCMKNHVITIKKKEAK